MISNEVLLLKLIKVNGSLSLLRKRGLTHAQIATLLQNHIRLNYVTLDENGVSLTIDGEKALSDNLASLNLKDKKKWILPQDVYYREPLSKEKIILPQKV